MKTLPSLLALFGPVLVLAGCSKPPAPAVKAPPPDVIVELPTSRGVTDYEDFTGRTEAYHILDVRPEVTGKLKTIQFNDGAFVSAGAPLFEIEDELFVAASKKAAADRKKAEADILNWKAQIELAKAELRRVEKAAEGSAASQNDVDKARATLDVNVAQLAAANAQLDASKATLDIANTQLGYTKIKSPYSGRISRHMIDAGNVVKANETILTRLVVLDPIYISFDIDERTVLTLRKLVSSGKISSSRDTQMGVKIGLADDDEYKYTAPITFRDNQLDLNTGTLRLRAEMKNPSLQYEPLPALVGHAAAMGVEHKGFTLLSPGMFIRVRMPVGKEHPGVMISEEALGSDQGQRFVYVLGKDNEAIRRNVKLGPQEGKFRVIDEGLTTGERVIVSGLQRVRPNMPVNPRMAGTESPKK